MKTRLILTLALLVCWLPGHPVTCNYLEGEENRVERGEKEAVEEVAERARDVDPPAQLHYPLEGNVDADAAGGGKVVEGKPAKEPEGEVDYEKLKVIIGVKSSIRTANKGVWIVNSLFKRFVNHLCYSEVSLYAIHSWMTLKSWISRKRNIGSSMALRPPSQSSLCPR